MSRGSTRQVRVRPPSTQAMATARRSARARRMRETNGVDGTGSQARPRKDSSSGSRVSAWGAETHGSVEFALQIAVAGVDDYRDADASGQRT